MGTGPISCLLLGISSDYARPITGQVTEVTWPVIGWAQPEFTPSDTRKTSPGVTIVGSPFTFHQSPPPLHTPTPPPPPPPPKPLPGAAPPWSPPVMAPDASQHPTIAVSTAALLADGHWLIPYWSALQPSGSILLIPMCLAVRDQLRLQLLVRWKPPKHVRMQMGW